MAQFVDVLAVPATGGYFVEDLAALQGKPTPVAERYRETPVTAGFRAVRQVAPALSVGLVLDTGRVAWGDCVAVAYTGKAGRDPLFDIDRGLTTVQDVVRPALTGKSVDRFRDLDQVLDALTEWVTETRVTERPPAPSQPLVWPKMSRRELLTAPARLLSAVQAEDSAQAPPPTETVRVRRPLPTAVRYGVSQALLAAVACAQNRTMTEVLCREWQLPLPVQPVALHAQSGADRYDGVDRMVARRIASLPHGLADDLAAQIGEDGRLLTQYTRWISQRIQALADPAYRPTIHLDVQGALGTVFHHQPGRILGQLFSLQSAARPYSIRVESPVVMETRSAQIELMRQLIDYTNTRHIDVVLVADEWANTLEDIQAFIDADAAQMIQIKMPDLGSLSQSVEAVLACRRANVGAFLGGSCAETDLSARASVHLALATRPDLLMAKPGMGVDEAVSLAQNEMARVLAEIHARAG
jgi:methylaspartate ammonia-lyase